ncbi:MAG: hypothetical protein QM811_28450 [Pirellulales bacterium]
MSKSIVGPLTFTISWKSARKYEFQLRHTPIRDARRRGPDEPQQAMGSSICNSSRCRRFNRYFRELGRDPTDVELETVAQTWSEHCSHKTLAGRVRYRDEKASVRFENMLKETIFAATRIAKAVGRQTIGA